MKYSYLITLTHGEYLCTFDFPIDLDEIAKTRWMKIEEGNDSFFYINIAQIVSMKMKIITDSDDDGQN